MKRSICSKESVVLSKTTDCVFLNKDVMRSVNIILQTKMIKNSKEKRYHDRSNYLFRLHTYFCYLGGKFHGSPGGIFPDMTSHISCMVSSIDKNGLTVSLSRSLGQSGHEQKQGSEEQMGFHYDQVFLFKGKEGKSNPSFKPLDAGWPSHLQFVKNWLIMGELAVANPSFFRFSSVTGGPTLPNF